jgi:predicted nucleic acid-binding protein
VEPSRTLKAVSQAEEAPGKISLEEDRSLELEVRRGKDSWKLWLRMHPAQREELLVYGLDTEVGELASDLYREQRRSEGLPAPEAGPR